MSDVAMTMQSNGALLHTDDKFEWSGEMKGDVKSRAARDSETRVAIA